MDGDSNRFPAFEVTVEAKSGAGAESKLLAFSIHSRRVSVIDILDRWMAEDHGYIKLRGDDEAIYILRHEVASDRWEITFFQDPKSPYREL